MKRLFDEVKHELYARAQPNQQGSCNNEITGRPIDLSRKLHRNEGEEQQCEYGNQFVLVAAGEA